LHQTVVENVTAFVELYDVITSDKHQLHWIVDNIDINSLQMPQISVTQPTGVIHNTYVEILYAKSCIFVHPESLTERAIQLRKIFNMTGHENARLIGV